MARVAALSLCLPCFLACVGAFRVRRGREAANFTVRDIRGNQIQYPLEAPSDPAVVQAAYVACGGHHCDLGIEAVRSFLAQAKLDGGKRPVLHLFVDEPCAARMQALAAEEPSLAGAAEIKVYLVGELNLSMPRDLYKRCASLRLSLPRLLPHLPRVLYMDTDTYVAGSLRRVWAMDPYLWAFGENDYSWYRDPDGAHCPRDWRKFVPADAGRNVTSCYYGTAGINSGVMLLNMSRWRELNMDAEVRHWVDTLTQHGEKPRAVLMGDQDIFNIVASVHAEQGYTSLLPCEMNSLYLNRYMCYYGPGDWESFGRSHRKHPENMVELHSMNLKRNARQPVIIHAKFKVNGHGEPMWKGLRDRLRLAVDRVSRSGGAGGAASLCEVARCWMG